MSHTSLPLNLSNNISSNNNNISTAILLMDQKKVNNDTGSSNGTFIPITFLIFGTSVIASYGISIYQAWNSPPYFDRDAIWALLYEKNLKPNYAAWFVFLMGAIFSATGFLMATFLLWNEHVSDALGFFYLLFLVSETAWMPLALRGAAYYSATIMVLLLASIASCGLFAVTLQLWGSDNYKGYLFFPLFLHCTFFDLIAWGCTFEPKNISVIVSQRDIFCVEEDHDHEKSALSKA